MQRDGGDSGYPTDVVYVRQFSPELAPPALRAAAALNGFVPPPGGDFDYCELGCGTGDSTNTLAAAHPDARFVGVDFNAEHVAFARGIASAGGLSNVRFLERDFAELAASPDLPRFDYVTAHGVLSWVSPALRAAVIAFAGARLKPGGILYVTYNAMPGWAAVEPLRRLMLDGAANVGGSTLDRARHGAGLAAVMCDAGAEYFTHNPAAREMLETMGHLGFPYVVHEYWGSDWHPMYFADVAAQMAERELGFIGQLPLYQNYRDLTVPPTAMDLFRRIGDRATFESLKDYAVNEFFRGDLYAKASLPRDPATTVGYLRDTRFGTLTPSSLAKREVRLRHHVLSYEEPVYQAILARLDAGACTVPELCAEPALEATDPEAVRLAVVRLLLGGQLAPMSEGPRAVAADYNRMVLAQRLSLTDPIILASPVAGTGVTVPALQAVSLRMLTGVPAADRAAWVRAFVERQPVRLTVRDVVVEEAEQQIAILLQEVEKTRTGRLPKLVELGVVDATAE